MKNSRSTKTAAILILFALLTTSFSLQETNAMSITPRKLNGPNQQSQPYNEMEFPHSQNLSFLAEETLQPLFILSSSWNENNAAIIMGTVAIILAAILGVLLRIEKREKLKNAQLEKNRPKSKPEREFP